MARLAVSTAVAVAVAVVTGSPQAGFAAFSMTYGATGFLDPAQQVRGPRLDDVKGTTAQYGTPVPHVYGHPRVAGQIVWCSDKQEVANTEESGGKGGPSTETTTYTYKIDLRILLSANTIPGVRRVWSNGKLVWSAAGDSETTQASAETDAWERMTVYTGAADQMPDPVEEAALGIANCPAYRGRGSVFIEGLNLGGSGYLPNLTFEIGEGEIGAGGTISMACTAEGEESEFVVPGYTVAMSGSGYRQAEVSEPAGVITSPFQGQKAAYALGTAAIGAIVSGTYTDNGPFSFRGAFWLDEPFGAFGNLYLFRLYDNTGTPVPFFGVRRDVSEDSTMRRWAIEFLGSEAMTVWALPGTGAHPANGWVVYEASYNGAGFVSFSVGGSPVLSLTRTPTGASREMSQVAWGVTADMSSERFAWDDFSAEIDLGATSESSITPAPLDEVLEDLAVRSGLEPSYLDFSSCAGKVVRALAVSQVTPARTVMQMLADANMQEFVESGGVLKTVARGGASVATIPYDKLGASQGDPVEPLPLKRLNDIELPRQVAITYQNTLADYQNGTEYSDRLLGGSTSVATTELALGMEPQEAKRLADFKLTDAVAGITQIGPLGLTREYARLEPTDVITPTDHTGSTFRARILKITDDGGLRTLECVLDDASAVNSEAVTDEDYESSTIVRAKVDTELELMDIPILRDADNDAGIYAAVTKSSNNGIWPGAALFKGINDTGWTEQATYTDRTFIGSTTTALAAWDDGAKFDEVSSVTVSGIGTLQSYTRDAILNGTANGYLIGSEVLYARTATLVTDGVYTLTGLLRGRRGTEWAAAEGAASGSRVVLLQNQGIRRIDFQTGELGSEYDFRAVTAGRSIGSAVTESITPEGVGLKPFSPADLRVSTVGGVQTLTWSRRTRLSMSPLGTCPLGETTESYDVEVRNGSDQIVLTATVNEPSCELGGLGQSFTMGAAQRIRQVGTDYIGITDAYPSPSSTRIIREDSDGQPAGSAPLGKTATALINNGDDIYVAVINGSSPAFVYRIQRTDINTSFLLTTSATYSPANAADPQGLAFDGTNVWVSGFYSGTVKKLNASTLAEVNSYSINTGIGAMVYEGGSLWICDRANNEVIEWDTATQTEVQRIACNGMPTDVFVANGLVFVAANQLQVFDAASGIQEASYVSGFLDVFRQVIQHNGTAVVFADLSSSQLVFLDDSTGDEDSRTGVSGLMGVSGYGGGNLFASSRSGSVVTTSAYESIAGLTGHTATVYQNSETVGRGYPASIEL